MPEDGDGSEDGGVDEEVPFDADTGGILTDDEGLADARAADGDDNAFEGLLSFLVSFTDGDHDTDGIAGDEVRDIAADLGGSDLLNQVLVHFFSPLEFIVMSPHSPACDLPGGLKVEPKIGEKNISQIALAFKAFSKGDRRLFSLPGDRKKRPVLRWEEARWRTKWKERMEKAFFAIRKGKKDFDSHGFFS